MKEKNGKISVGPRQVSLFISFPPIEYIATAKGLKLELSCGNDLWRAPSQDSQAQSLEAESEVDSGELSS